MSEPVQEDQRPNPCCRDETNLGARELLGRDLTFRRCKVCNCRHFEFMVDAGELGARMT